MLLPLHHLLGTIPHSPWGIKWRLWPGRVATLCTYCQKCLGCLGLSAGFALGSRRNCFNRTFTRSCFYHHSHCLHCFVFSHTELLAEESAQALQWSKHPYLSGVPKLSVEGDFISIICACLPVTVDILLKDAIGFICLSINWSITGVQ